MAIKNYKKVVGHITCWSDGFFRNKVQTSEPVDWIDITDSSILIDFHFDESM